MARRGVLQWWRERRDRRRERSISGPDIEAQARRLRGRNAGDPGGIVPGGGDGISPGI